MADARIESNRSDSIDSDRIESDRIEQVRPRAREQRATCFCCSFELEELDLLPSLAPFALMFALTGCWSASSQERPEQEL